MAHAGLDLNGGDIPALYPRRPAYVFRRRTGFEKQMPEKVTRYLTDGFLFSSYFAP